MSVQNVDINKKAKMRNNCNHEYKKRKIISVYGNIKETEKLLLTFKIIK